LLKSDPEFEVIGTASNGEEAVAFVASQKPDVILMDVHMPKMDGIEATRRIMETQPVPIVMTSASMHPDDISWTFCAMEAGALAVADKSAGVGSPNFDETVRRLKQTLKLMSEVKVVRRWNRQGKTPPVKDAIMRPPSVEVRLVAIGVSTGGPPVLRTLLSGLPKNFAAPLLIVQHITPGFLTGLTEWLSQTSGIPCQIATHGLLPLPGHAYMAPDDLHMGVDTGGRIVLARLEPENGLRPAVSYLFRSVTQCLGRQAIGVLLTGMGKDGAQDLKLLRQRGAVTIAQDKESSIVHGMPGEAIALGAASYVLPPEGIAATLTRLVNR
jgi:two-component system chemotaxis response regulator CheB